jgi:guanine nucleotide-binding protein subunit alpha
MGCCQSTEDIEGRQRNDEIDNQLKKDRINMKSEIKMLLLGEDSNIVCLYAAVVW